MVHCHVMVVDLVGSNLRLVHPNVNNVELVHSHPKQVKVNVVHVFQVNSMTNLDNRIVPFAQLVVLKHRMVSHHVSHVNLDSTWTHQDNNLVLLVHKESIHRVKDQLIAQFVQLVHLHHQRVNQFVATVPLVHSPRLKV